MDCRRDLIPTRDHSHAAKSKNYRYSCNAQVLIRGRDLEIVAITAVDRVIATTPCTTADQTSNGCAARTAASLPTEDIAASPSSSRLPSAVVAWCAMPRGVVTVVDAHASNTPSHGSKSGGCCGTIDAKAITWQPRSLPSHCFTIFR